MVVDAAAWSRVATMLAQRLGLHFPDDRLPDLRRGFEFAAAELSLPGADDLAGRLLADRLDPTGVEALATHLTIGETYFLRGEETFAALANHVLPALLKARNSTKRLRIWSAACCTGEEAYSLAILLRQVIPDIDDWQISILATDINPRFLRKAIEGTYGTWSFRGTSDAFRERWFRRTAEGRYRLVPEVRRMVTFAPLNLVDGSSPSLSLDTGGTDLILCRNVLMYFTPGQAARVVSNLHRALRSDGWLAVAPCEVSASLFSGFEQVGFEGAILYRRKAAVPGQDRAPAPPITLPSFTRIPNEPPPRHSQATPLRRRLRAVPSVAIRGPSEVEQGAPLQPGDQSESMSREARSLANQGRLAEALDCCERWIATNKTDAQAHYLRAVVLLERGERTEARTALRHSLYLDPDNPMTCFAAGNLDRLVGHRASAMRHYRHVLELLGRLPDDAMLARSEGITAAQLTALVTDLLLAEAG